MIDIIFFATPNISNFPQYVPNKKNSRLINAGFRFYGLADEQE
jgi:hypothetical protein